MKIEVDRATDLENPVCNSTVMKIYCFTVSEALKKKNSKAKWVCVWVAFSKLYDNQVFRLIPSSEIYELFVNSTIISEEMNGDHEWAKQELELRGHRAPQF